MPKKNSDSKKKAKAKTRKCRDCKKTKGTTYFFGNSDLCRKCGYNGKGFSNVQANGTSSRRLKRSILNGVETMDGVRHCVSCEKKLSMYNVSDTCHACDGRFVSMRGLEN